ncbi:MAG: helix-turn-helix transcriptional regulator [Actinomycetota bacterium]|nr:helix-turn-helix transcriptional regulator [Actinomycetota bacterium]
MSRSYGQFCGLARALDVIGDRWSLLIVRQLLVSPARYTELQAGLPGVATNLLAERLRYLEQAGVLDRRPAEDGAAITYALTRWGAELREPIEALVRWSTPLMARGPGDDRFQLEWLAIALPALLAGRQGRGAIGIAVDGEILQVRVTSSGVDVGHHDGRELLGVLHADPWVVLGLASGVLDLDGVSADIDGDRDAVRAVFERQPSNHRSEQRKPARRRR